MRWKIETYKDYRRALERCAAIRAQEVTLDMERWDIYRAFSAMPPEMCRRFDARDKGPA